MIEYIESPNQGFRKKVNIDMIILHATGSDTLKSTVEWFKNPKSQVSAHYVIGKDGTIVQMVKEAKKSWHAGKSSWWNGKDIEEFLNENSIGIEIVNKDDARDNYTDEQIDALARLIVDIQHAYPIPDERILGHSQIAPGRKVDPNINFPWIKLGVLIHTYREALNAIEKR